ncbi:MAG: DEAD/DEAH box helicase [Armatimonadetes bacterium]|nr:DEAD/DEAH box helicase [Armatimonadota bacterium]
MGVQQVLEDFIKQEERKGTVAAVHRSPARGARYGAWPAGLRPELRSCLENRGIDRLYSHQGQAVESVLDGKHTVIVTPTASGKTLCYNLPVLHSVLDDPTARALYMFPTKALSQDQLAELMELRQNLGAELGVFTYDGDTPSDARRAIRSRGNVVITNPDMLHTGILPHHTKWSRFFANLRYVVIDELHTYRGVFGSHLANVLRRLRRICRFHGSNPVFVMCSATIANPEELASRLIEEPVRQVGDSGAPSGEKTLVFYNPPMLNKELGIRRSYISATRRIAARFLKEDVRTIVFAASRLNVEVLTRSLKDRFERTHAEEGRIRGYRGGYLPGKRREIERGLREGSVLGVISTNALELGIDIGTLEAAVLAGYPGTVASTWQQAGRAGRRQDSSAIVMVARSDPLDQFLMEHPEYFLGASPEHALINPDNLPILVSHVKCAAFELPFEEGERFGEAEIGEVVRFLADRGVLHRSGDQYHWTQEAYPADHISLRSASPENFVIMDVSQNDRVIAEVDWHSAPSTVYQDAIYMCEARTFIVTRLDYAQRRAYVKPVGVDYYTDAITSTSVKILDGFEREERAGVRREHGEVHVSWRVSGFKKIKFDSRENVGYGEVNLPDHEMHTTAFWLTLEDRLLAGLGFARSELLDGVVGLAYCMHHLAPFFLMCDIRDLDRCVGDRAAEWFARADRDPRGRYTFATEEEREDPGAESWLRIGLDGEPTAALQAALDRLPSFEPTLFLYDNYPGGMGFSPQLYDSFDELLQRATERLETCPCESGCPSCVGPPNEVGNRAREVGLSILRALRAPVAVGL